MCAVSFQSQSQTQTQNQKTHAGLIAGSVLAADQLFDGIENRLELNELKFTKDSNEYKRALKRLEKIGIKEEQEASNLIEKISTNLKQSKRARSAILLGAVALSIGCGAFVDHVRNKKAEAMRKTINEKGVEGALVEGHDIRLNSVGSPYYHSKDGAKFGPLLGLGVGIIRIISMYFSKSLDNYFEISKSILKNKGSEIKNLKSKALLVGSIITLPVFVLGGWLMGCITDKLNNKKAEKNSLKNIHESVYI